MIEMHVYIKRTFQINLVLSFKLEIKSEATYSCDSLAGKIPYEGKNKLSV